MLRKVTIATAVCAVALVGANASAAFGGEVTGNGKPTVARRMRTRSASFRGTTMTPTPLWMAAGPTAPAVCRSPTGRT
jgi:hypothetical protein